MISAFIIWLIVLIFHRSKHSTLTTLSKRTVQGEKIQKLWSQALCVSVWHIKSNCSQTENTVHVNCGDAIIEHDTVLQLPNISACELAWIKGRGSTGSFEETPASRHQWCNEVWWRWGLCPSAANSRRVPTLILTRNWPKNKSKKDD